MSALATSSSEQKRYDAEVRAAWRIYYNETKGVWGLRYDEVEPWAWARLQFALSKAGT